MGLLHREAGGIADAERSLRTAVGLAMTAPVLSFEAMPRMV